MVPGTATVRLEDGRPVLRESAVACGWRVREGAKWRLPRLARRIFKRYNIRDAVQAEALERRNDYLARQRGTTPTVPVLPSLTSR